MYKNKAVYSAYPWSSDFNVALSRQVSGMLHMVTAERIGSGKATIV